MRPKIGTVSDLVGPTARPHCNKKMGDDFFFILFGGKDGPRFFFYLFFLVEKIDHDLKPHREEFNASCQFALAIWSCRVAITVGFINHHT